LRKYLVAVIAALTALAFATVAVAQGDPATLNVTVSPKKAGTKKKPKNESLRLAIVNNDQSRTMSSLDITMPKTLTVSGKGFKTCSADTLDNETKAACPKGSKVGSGVAKAILGVNNADPTKRVNLTFNVTAFVGGKNKINFYLEGIVNVTSPGTLSKKNGKQVLHIDVPPAAQSPDGGLTFAGLVSLDTTLKGTAKKNKLIASTGCKAKKDPFSVVLTFINNTVSPAGTVTAKDDAPCS
jgi:hypothetical protein